MKNLTVFVALILVFSAVFFATFTLSSETTITTNCNDVSSPDVGVNCFYSCRDVNESPEAGSNCLYSSPTDSSSLLPLCKSFSSPNWTILPSAILPSGTTLNHRVNCADLADLPLCSQLTDNLVTGYPFRNCVNECSDPSFDEETGVRGQDYAVHNRHCVRFCDAIENDITDDEVKKECVTRNCHQVPYILPNSQLNVKPNPPWNCNSLSCNLLTTDELNDTKFGSTYTSDYKYCGNDKKCYDFTKDQLQYLVPSKMCQVHNCRVTCVDNLTDDVQKILDKGSDFVSAYKNYISVYEPGTASDILCTPITCKPILNITYLCIPKSNDTEEKPHGECDKIGDGAKCSNGYCYKTVDCNLPENENSGFCLTADDSTLTVGTTDDSTVHSWFYRPRPMDSATNGSGGLLDFSYDDNFSVDNVCYTQDQMKDREWGEDVYVSLFGLSIYLGYYHAYSRSPGKCDTPDLGLRGAGYGYLCGNNGNIFSNTPNSYAGYSSGYAETTFTDDIEGINKVSACLRFNAAGAVGKSCGKRECQITCAFGVCTQICGRDVCVDLIVKDSDPYQCMMDKELFEMVSEVPLIGVGNTTRPCMKTIDRYMRIRAVKYGDYVCNFLDVKGTTAYNNDFFKGSEKILNGTYCVSGTLTGGSCSGGKNTNDDDWEATKWRTILQIPYIQNNQSDGPRGYLDKSGRLFPEQECVKVGHRITVPFLYNLANMSNSARIFVPPLYILSASTIEGGNISPADEGEDFGETDFHNPEMSVRFGAAIQKLSLDFGKTGYEVEPGEEIDTNGRATVTTSVSGSDGGDTFTLDIFVRKEYEDTTGRPTFCLYQKVKNIDGEYLDPQRISCVYRSYPEIDKTIFSGDTHRKILVSADDSNTYSSSKIVVKYLSSSIANDTCGSTTAKCSKEFSLSNPDPSIETCDEAVTPTEKYKICVRREWCSQLNIECIQNEINLHTAEINNQPTDSYLTIQDECNGTILSICNKKFGIISSSTATVTNPNPDGAASDPDAYGWFNEICITSGFDTKLRAVVAKKTDLELMTTEGKCVIDLSKQKAGADCSLGGKKPDCPCLEYVEDTSLGNDQYTRLETAHEAGLCIDMPLPQLCPAINHNLTPNPNNSNDLDYVASSLNQTIYGSDTSKITDVVHISHQYRDIGLSPTIPIAGHAKFPNALFGFDDVRGECLGFWQNALLSGAQVPPTMSCLNDNGVAVWGSVTNPCVRYSCPEVTTSGADSSGNYQGIYTDVTDPLTRKGQKQGFATWPSIISSDFLQTATAASCIAGYKKVGATAIINTAIDTHCVAGDATKAALYGCITGYSGGTDSTRLCNQRGEWQTPQNSCERITCPKINLDANNNVTNIPSNPDSEGRWALWGNSGGAYFPAAEAAISTSLIDNTTVKTGATSEGTCYETLGFFTSGSQKPTRVCDYLGNWGPVQNACVTECNAITCDNISCKADDPAHGYATWNEVTGVPINAEIEVTSSSCISGKVVSPYKPRKNKYGNAYTLGSALTYDSNNNILTIPTDISKDTRGDDSLIHRVCTSLTTAGNQSNVWSGTSRSCISQCPGFDVDDRIGVGKTKHKVNNKGGNIQNVVDGMVTISWTSTDFNTWAYNGSDYDVNAQNASHYTHDRTNGEYFLARYCNGTGQWSEPIPLCIGNGGEVKTAPNTYQEGFITARAFATYLADYIAVLDAEPSDSVGKPQKNTGPGNCISGTYSSDTGSDAAPSINCVYKDDNHNIDETYFSTGGNTLCTPMCKSVAGESHGNATDPGDDNVEFYLAGTKLNLVCKSGYGSDILDGSSLNSSQAFNDCGRGAAGVTTTDRSSLGPYITCTSSENGSVASWSSPVSNNCEPCRGCDANSLMLGNNSYKNEIYIKNNECNEVSSSAYDLWLDYCDDNYISIATNSAFKIGFLQERRCKQYDSLGFSTGCSGNERNVCLAFNVNCIDNAVYVSDNAGYKASIGDESTSCGSGIITCRSRTEEDNCN